MIRIGVIGDIGSGKSHAARIFGYPVFNADKEVARLYKKNKKCYKKLKKKLPKYITSFPIKKNEIFKAILDNKKNLKKIVKIIHPLVRSKMNEFIKQNKGKRIVILDIPLLLENKINKKSDILIFINAKKKLINRRIRKRHGVNLKIVKELKKLQLPLELKKRKADFVIENNFNNNFIKKNVKKVLRKIL